MLLLITSLRHGPSRLLIICHLLQHNCESHLSGKLSWAGFACLSMHAIFARLSMHRSEIHHITNHAVQGQATEQHLREGGCSSLLSLPLLVQNPPAPVIPTVHHDDLASYVIPVSTMMMQSNLPDKQLVHCIVHPRGHPLGPM